MNGLAPQTSLIFGAITKLECIKPFVLVGGTALSLQLGTRQSEDLDFMRWKQDSKDSLEVGWPKIKRELETIGIIESENIMGFDHVEFVVNGVKLSFYAAPRKAISTMSPILYQNNLRIADVKTIGAMKMEVMLRLAKFRDYYDLYSILKSGVDIQELIPMAIEHSGYKLKTKNLLSMITNGELYTKDSSFSHLQPTYEVTPKEIEEFIKSKLADKNKVLGDYLTMKITRV